jgi:hypothetical protein
VDCDVYIGRDEADIKYYGEGATNSGVHAAIQVPCTIEHPAQAAGTPAHQPAQVTGAVTPAVTPTNPRQAPYPALQAL